MRKIWLLLTLALGMTLPAATPFSAAGDELSDGFTQPPDQAKPQTWWHWMNGNVTKEGISADLEAMKRVGLGGATMFQVDQDIPAGPVGYMSPQWREMFKHAASEADRLGLALSMHNCAGWSSSGGPWVDPAHAMQKLTWAETPFSGPAKFDAALPQPKTNENFYRDIAVLAYRTPAGDQGEASRISNLQAKIALDRIDPLQPGIGDAAREAALPVVAHGDIVDLTAKLTPDGHLAWEAPAGQWTILRLGYTLTGARNAPAPPEGRGLECDKLSTEALTVHWNGMAAQVVKDLGPLAGKALTNMLIDSYEMGYQNWTPRFREEFSKRRGYDPLPWLPVTTGRVVESAEASERFLWDFRRTIADLYADNYYGYFAELCHKNGIKASIEPYGNGPFDNLQSAAGADVVMGEFWVPDGSARETVKLAAAAAHINGRSIVGAESFTTGEQQGRWTVDPYSIKALGDMIFCLGVNRYIIHRYAMQPWLDKFPGMTMGPWGTHFDRTVTWWEQGAAWLSYAARCQYLLQSGRFVADALYFTGEAGPNDLTFRPGLRPELPAGYDYDGCDARTLLERSSVKDGQVALAGGMTYRVLVLPDSPFMTPAMLNKVRDLAQAGATIVGPRPEKSPSLVGFPQCDAEVKQLAGEIWGACDGKTVTENKLGQGRIIWGKTLEAVFAELEAKPDFEFSNDDGKPRIMYIHRTTGDAEVYFVSNQKNRAERVTCTFRVSGKAPELWHADTGKMEMAPVWEEKDGRVSVPLSFDPAGSVFVVFRQKASAADHMVAFQKSGGEDKKTTPTQVVIQKATYGTRNSSADVTAKVAEMVAKEQYDIPADNATYGDTAPMQPKRLRVEYTLNGKPLTRSAEENGTLDLVDVRGAGIVPPDYELAAAQDGSAQLTAWQAGTFEFRTAQGKTNKVEVKDAAQALDVTGPWSLHFPPKWGAPESVQLEKLISWTDHPEAGVRYFSGTAVYTRELDVPAELIGAGKTVSLDLGRVKNFAEVILNGQNLGVLWKEPFRVDVSKAIKAGKNSLEVRVTNLWPNRLIGDEQLPDDCEWDGTHLKAWPEWLVKGQPRPSGRLTFATWRYYKKDSPLLESGLIGPVTLRAATPVPVELH